MIVSITVSQIARYIHYKAHYSLSLQDSPFQRVHCITVHYTQPVTDSLLHSVCYRQPISDTPLHSACYRQPISDHPLQTVTTLSLLQTAHFRHSTTDSSLHSACYRQPISDSSLHSVCYRQPISDNPLQTVHYTQSVTDSPFQTIHYRPFITLSLLQTAHFRLSITDSPLHWVCYRQTALLQIVHHSQYIKTVHFVAVNGPFQTVYYIYRQPITLITTTSITANDPFSDCSLRTLKVHHWHSPTVHYSIRDNPLQTVHCKIYSCRWSISDSPLLTLKQWKSLTSSLLHLQSPLHSVSDSPLLFIMNSMHDIKDWKFPAHTWVFFAF